MGYPGFGDDDPDMAPIWEAQQDRTCECARKRKPASRDLSGLDEYLDRWKKSMDEWDRKVLEFNGIR